MLSSHITINIQHFLHYENHSCLLDSNVDGDHGIYDYENGHVPCMTIDLELHTELSLAN